MPEIKLNTLEIFQWKVNPSRRVPYERQNSGAFWSSLTEAISPQALLPPGEGQSSVSHQLQPGDGANTVYDNGSVRMHLNDIASGSVPPFWISLYNTLVVIKENLCWRSSIFWSSFSLFCHLSFVSLSSTWYSHKKCSIARKPPFHSAFSSNSGFSRIYTRRENISYPGLPTVLLGSVSLAKGKLFICALSTAQRSGWQRDCGKQVLGTSY